MNGDQGDTRMQRLSLKRALVYGLTLVTLLYIISKLSCGDWNVSRNTGPRMVPRDPVIYSTDSHNNSYSYDRDMPLIFIGGMPRSGTTLMRAILDAHPDVRCGEETRVVPRLLGLKTQWQRSEKESKRLLEAGITDEVLNSAMSAFILEIIAKHAEPAPRLCNKDPFTLKSTLDLIKMFPNAQFLLMIRDGRAVVHSIISRGVTITGFDLKDYKGCLQKWNTAVENMYLQCRKAGPSRCMLVHYEQLVLHPEPIIRSILQFLNIVWNDVVLHHDELINKPGGVSLSNVERSTDQVIKPINLVSLTEWANHVPSYVKSSMHSVAPMLKRLGYDPNSYPPNYGKADKLVEENTKKVRSNQDFWKERAAAVQSIAKSPGLPVNDLMNDEELRRVMEREGDEELSDRLRNFENSPRMGSRLKIPRLSIRKNKR